MGNYSHVLKLLCYFETLPQMTVTVLKAEGEDHKCS